MTHGAWVTVRVAGVQGSAPRDVGAAMQVFASHQSGSIGGGALEWEATKIARSILKGAQAQMRRKFPLGPDLGQCCGGAVTLDFCRDQQRDAPEAPPLWIWGAGHVGRAVAATLAPLQDRTITLIDTTAERMPQDVPQSVTPLVAADPLRVVALAPQGADHLVMTYDHALDLNLCSAVLGHGFGSLGLIGSSTKWARFQRRLQAMGHSRAAISRITCPIGDPSLGKHPQAIAIGVASAFVLRKTPAS